MSKFDLCLIGKSFPVNNRNVQRLEEVLLRKDIGEFHAGQKFMAAELEVFQGTPRSIRFQLGKNRWTKFMKISEATEPKRERRAEFNEEEEFSGIPEGLHESIDDEAGRADDPEPAVEVTTENDEET